MVKRRCGRRRRPGPGRAPRRGPAPGRSRSTSSSARIGRAHLHDAHGCHRGLLCPRLRRRPVRAGTAVRRSTIECRGRLESRARPGSAADTTLRTSDVWGQPTPLTYLALVRDRRHIPSHTRTLAGQTGWSNRGSRHMPTEPSPAQSEASRLNDARSTDLATAAGKARAALNGVRHGVFGRTFFLLPDEDPGEFRQHEAMWPPGPARLTGGRPGRIRQWRDRADRPEAHVPGDLFAAGEIADWPSATPPRRWPSRRWARSCAIGPASSASIGRRWRPWAPCASAKTQSRWREQPLAEAA